MYEGWEMGKRNRQGGWGRMLRGKKKCEGEGDRKQGSAALDTSTSTDFNCSSLPSPHQVHVLVYRVYKYKISFYLELC